MGKTNYNQFNKIHLGFGDVILNKKHLPKISNINNYKGVYKEKDRRVQFDISNYRHNGIEYDLYPFPFIDSTYAGFICHEYLY